jgi:hypothetical protein
LYLFLLSVVVEKDMHLPVPACRNNILVANLALAGVPAAGFDKVADRGYFAPRCSAICIVPKVLAEALPVAEVPHLDRPVVRTSHQATHRVIKRH